MDGTVEDNSENGIYVESGAQAEIDSSIFKSNGAIGIYLVGPGQLGHVSKTVFESHSDSGTAFVEGVGKVTGSRLQNNPMAVFYAQGSQRDGHRKHILSRARGKRRSHRRTRARSCCENNTVEAGQ